MMMIFLISYLFSGVASFAVNAKTLEKCTTLNCLLEGLEITIPDVSEDIPLIGKFTLRQLKIFNLGINSLTVVNYPNESHIEDGLKIRLDATLELDGFLTMSNDFTIKSRIDSVSLEVALKFNKAEDGLVENVTLYDEKCAFGLDFDTLVIKCVKPSFGCSITAGILQASLITTLPTVLGPILCDSLIPQLLGDMLTGLFQSGNEYLRPLIQDVVLKEIPLQKELMSDLRKSNLIDLVRFIVSDLISNENSPLNINSLINRFMGDSGEIRLKGIASLFNIPLPLAMNFDIPNVNGTVNLTVDDLGISGYNQWYNLSALNPISPYILDTHTGLRNLGINMSATASLFIDSLDLSTITQFSADSIAASKYFSNAKIMENQSNQSEYSDEFEHSVFRFLPNSTTPFSIKYNKRSPKAEEENIKDIEIIEYLNLKTKMINNEMNITMQLANEIGVGSNYTTNQCLNIDCLLDLLNGNGTGITGIELRTNIEQLDLETNGTIDDYLEDIVGTILNFFISNYVEMVPALLSGALNTYLVDIVNDKLGDLLNNANCAYIPDPEYSDFEMIPTVGSVGGAVFLVLIICLFLLIVSIKIKKRSNQMRKINSDDGDSNNNGIDDNCEENYYDEDKKEGKEKREYKNDTSFNKDEYVETTWDRFWRSDDQASLLMHPLLPLWVRILMPLLIFLNVALFISSNASLGASVFIKIALGSGKKIELPSLFDFGLINSITDMWEAKTYILSVLIAVMSCIWPYTKLLLMVIVWILPAHVMKKTIRSRILRVLDALGKWSMLDSYVMILMLIAFHMSLEFPIYDSNEVHEPSVFNLWVFPAYGFFTLMLGTVVSLALSHVICALNRYVKRRSDDGEAIEYDSVEKSAVFMSQNIVVNIVLFIMLAGSIALFITGFLTDSFTFEFVGLAGWAIDLLDTPNSNTYTVVNLGTKIPECAEFPNSFVVRFTQFLYFVISVATPYLHLICLTVMYLVPMTKKALYRLHLACETLYAWASLDVFIISVFACVLEIGQFAQFIVGDSCDAINPIIKDFFGHEKFIEGHETCFEAITHLLNGSYFLIAAVVLHTIATIWINYLSRKALREEESSSSHSALSLTQEKSTDIDDEFDNQPLETIDNLDKHLEENAKPKELLNSSGSMNSNSNDKNEDTEDDDDDDNENNDDTDEADNDDNDSSS